MPEKKSITERTIEIPTEEQVRRLLSELDPELSSYYAYMISSGLGLIRTLLNGRDPVPLFGRLMLDDVTIPQILKTLSVQFEEEMRRHALSFNRYDYDENAANALDSRMSTAIGGDERKIHRDLIGYLSEGGASAAAGIPKIGENNRLEKQLMDLGLTSEQALDLIIGTRDAVGLVLFMREQKSGSGEPSKHNGSEEAGASIHTDTEGIVTFCGTGKAVAVRDMTASMRKLSRKTRSAFAYVHNGLTALIAQAAKGDKNALISKLPGLIPYEKDAAEVGAQIENSSMACAVFRRDAAGVGTAPSLEVLKADLQPLRKQFDEKKEDHPLYRALALLIQGAACALNVPDCMTDDKAMLDFGEHADWIKAVLGAKFVLGLYTPPDSPTAELTGIGDELRQTLCPDGGNTLIDMKAMWAELRKYAEAADLDRLGKWLSATKSAIAWFASDNDRIRMVMPQERTWAQNALVNARVALLALVDSALQFEREAKAAGQTDLTYDRSDFEQNCRYEEITDRLSQALRKLELFGSDVFRSGFIFFFGLATILEREDAVEKGEIPEDASQPKLPTVVTREMRLPAMAICLIGGKVARLLNDGDNAAEEEEEESPEIRRMRELARVFAEG